MLAQRLVCRVCMETVFVTLMWSTCNPSFANSDAFTAGATALTCTATSGSPSTADCEDVAEYLLSRPNDQQCDRTSAGTSNCTPLYNSGTCVASICGTEGQGIPCQDAGADVAALAVGCATGGTGTLESTTTAGSTIPWGNGNLLITIGHI